MINKYKNLFTNPFSPIQLTIFVAVIELPIQTLRIVMMQTSHLLDIGLLIESIVKILLEKLITHQLQIIKNV